MKISQLSLKNFRNYPTRDFSFDPELTIIVGPNGAGKTNVLEAIYLLATGESWRAGASEEMMRFEEDVAHVSGVISENSEHSDNRTVRKPENQKARKSDALTFRDSDSSDSQSFPSVPKPTELHITLSRGVVQGKRVAKVKYRVDGVAKRKSDFVGRLKVVLFEPESLEIVIGDPEHRRRFLDEALSQTDAEYRNDLLVYSRALRVRNRLLDAIREGKTQRESLDFWERAMVKHGEGIQERRREMVEWLNGRMAKTTSTASKGQALEGLAFLDFLELEYDASSISDQRLDQYREREVAAGFTLVGPQRDDLKIISKDEGRGSSILRVSGPNGLRVEGRALAQYGSRGEQRMAVLRLKLAETEWIEEKTGESPVLLLDDIFSELDDVHDQMVQTLVAGRQTIITATEISEVLYPKSQIIKL